jgi:hypothetical protein
MAYLIKERVGDSHALILRQLSQAYNAAKKSDLVESRREKIRLMGEIINYCNNQRLLNDLLCAGCTGSKELADDIAAQYGAAQAVAADKKTSAGTPQKADKE